MDRVLLTTAGSKMLWQELGRLKRESRPRIIEAIAEARAHGDLSENAEYHAAREQQGFTEGRIRELEASLSNAEILGKNKKVSKRTAVGTKVYFAPSDEANVGVLDTTTNAFSTIATGLTGDQKYSGAAAVGTKVGSGEATVAGTGAAGASAPPPQAASIETTAVAIKDKASFLPLDLNIVPVRPPETIESSGPSEASAYLLGHHDRPHVILTIKPRAHLP